MNESKDYLTPEEIKEMTNTSIKKSEEIESPTSKKYEEIYAEEVSKELSKKPEGFDPRDYWVK